MDSTACHVIYVNRAVARNRIVSAVPDNQSRQDDDQYPDHIRRDIKPLLDAFGDVYLCSTGAACLQHLLALQENAVYSMSPAIVLIDTPHTEQITPSQIHSPTWPAAPTASEAAQSSHIAALDNEIYGLSLLQQIITESHLRCMAKRVVPVPVISYPEPTSDQPREQMTDGATDVLAPVPLNTPAAHRPLIRKCLDLGAVDVIISPLSSKCITTLEICAYKAHRDAAREQQELLEITHGRKRSWVGVSDQEPFAYLREAMVSNLMKGICRMAPDDNIATAHVSVPAQRQSEIASAVSKWHFCANSFTDDELLVGAMFMFQHALSMPELERWRLPADKLIKFLVACRTAYNSFVPYHNFRHVVDVLQATFHFLVNVGALASYPARDPTTPVPKSPIASLLTPFDALTLLITAIGHDVGHPGVNNGFLATLNAPLAQLYNDRSVLESFHCAAYAQILRRYWPAAFEDRGMRALMISSILATDMGLHFDYMKKLGDLQEKLHDNDGSEGWNGRQLEEYKSLACSLIIKCADVSNVARHHDAAVKWMHILVEEFSRQASMENELGIKSSLIAEPKRDLLSLSNAQLGFMNMFAIPLFQGVADIMPSLKYAVDELEINRQVFEQKVHDEKLRLANDGLERRKLLREGTFSPKTRSWIAEEGDETTEGVIATPQRTEGSDSTVIHTSETQISEQHEPAKEHTVGAEDVAQEMHDTVRDFYNPAQSEHDVYKHLNGTASAFDAVRDFADSDPFHVRPIDESGGDGKATLSTRQRCSETTEGSVSGAFTGDWASQATSATGKANLSPSTQGTSIVSNDSMDRTLGLPSFNVEPPVTQSEPPQSREGPIEQDASESLSNSGSIGKAEGKSLRKKTSRFRMKDFPFFRRNKGSSPSSPPFPAADATS
ncbi:3'5'-cyclic nucleotide phosphodiesterase, catalytic domain protein [Cordyceps fumosorosea ARSEF 2679]|uniref:Phosphodiesterase n=1 Tax=Cordyceps fumosorosea (strain ARSEF 2679) TaxID=1081104 RepID=A0A168EQS0_CORFA|nr:3'5'-cyclic nucleotide phosphodiesterase, catalytic domain protein [Cordyceps fumosorosea ARSEF 2679]OAA74107.1 3'5'-cyclic nucleotide phosphodiesterase, catalytic domain protein [Cordyceps fumosorosea ARSEF 2679]